jgi:hypothetical protein
LQSLLSRISEYLDTNKKLDTEYTGRLLAFTGIDDLRIRGDFANCTTAFTTLLGRIDGHVRVMLTAEGNPDFASLAIGLDIKLNSWLNRARSGSKTAIPIHFEATASKLPRQPSTIKSVLKIWTISD